MDVAVCVKHVPDTEAAIRIRADRQGIDESGLPFVMNYYDEHGVEEALRIKERLGGTVTLLAAGPVRAALALRSGLAMGADAAVHVEDPALEGADHLGVAKALAAAISAQHYDLILCGKLATDDNAAIVGRQLPAEEDRKSTRLNSSHEWISYAVFCLKKKKKKNTHK